MPSGARQMPVVTDVHFGHAVDAVPAISAEGGALNISSLLSSIGTLLFARCERDRLGEAPHAACR